MLILCLAALFAFEPASAALADPAGGGRVGRAPEIGGPLIYRGGPVMHSSRIHAIYWAPAGHSFPTGYTALVDAFFKDVAADGGHNANVFASVKQYTDSQGAATDRASYAGGVVDDAAYPPSGCSLAGISVCLTDSQVQAEVDRLVAAKSLPRGLGDLYVLFTPSSVGTCGYEGGCSYHGYCAYHAWIGTRAAPTLYAVIPYADVAGCRGPSSPNGNAADQAIDDAGHEYAEAVTDPLANAWIDATGNENGDKCLSWFNAPLGKTRFGDYNAVIGGGVYELQGEWSNAYGGCVGGLAQFGFTPTGAPSGDPVRFDARSSSGPGGTITHFAWHFGDGSSASGPIAVHRFAHAGGYGVMLTVSAGSIVVSTHRVVEIAPRRPQITIVSRALGSTLANGLTVRVAGEGTGRLTITLLRRGQRPLSLAVVRLRLSPGRSRIVHIPFGKRARTQLVRLRHPRIAAVLTQTVNGNGAGTASSAVTL